MSLDSRWQDKLLNIQSAKTCPVTMVHSILSEGHLTLHSEILEQPERLAHLLNNQQETVEKIVAEIRKREIRYVFLAARGTSDNAGRYANYLWGAQNQLPLALATPSLFTYYNRPPKLEGALVVGISQSGQSPDIVSVIEEGRRQGCLTLSITNEPESHLANAAELLLDIQAGEEKAIAASKTYTNELMSIAMLSAVLADDKKLKDELKKVSAWADKVLQQDKLIAHLVERYRYMRQCVVLARGFNYCTAFEWALKLKELTYTIAEPYSSADFQHGPIALVEGGFPILSVAPRGKVLDSMLEMLNRLRTEHLAEVIAISDDKRVLSLAQSAIQLPMGIPEWLTPIICIIPAQLFAYHLTLAKGLDPERPRSIGKVTETH
jgi:glucosamine--fructose-6-phosphate aminotransferase (isomerizing)